MPLIGSMRAGGRQEEKAATQRHEYAKRRDRALFSQSAHMLQYNIKGFQEEITGQVRGVGWKAKRMGNSEEAMTLCYDVV